MLDRRVTSMQDVTRLGLPTALLTMLSPYKVYLCARK